MGFDRMQIAAIKRNYANLKPIFAKMDRLAVKVNAMIDEHRKLQANAVASDSYTRNMAKDVTGYDLTSDAVLKFHNDPEAWEKFKADHPLEGENVAAPAEETPAETPVEAPAGDAEVAPATTEEPATETPSETAEPAEETEAVVPTPSVEAPAEEAAPAPAESNDPFGE